MTRRYENKAIMTKKETDFTDEQRAWFAKWILDNKCWFQEYYYNKNKHLIGQFIIPNLEGKLIEANGYSVNIKG